LLNQHHACLLPEGHFNVFALTFWFSTSCFLALRHTTIYYQFVCQVYTMNVVKLWLVFSSFQKIILPPSRFIGLARISRL
jgi:hypothetical protein